MVKRILQTPIMHRMVEHNGVVYLGGIVADDRSQSMGGQTAQICEKIDALLAEAGTDKTKLLTAMLYITDMSQKDAMNQAWTRWIEAGDLPTRATIGVADLGKDILIEIVVSAAV
ncbi:RidA family protein [Aurantimonas sp. MSK8Z-1]|uniref:RidA family protein n=1 Tax=Mangrovibrevibacter kandeliae TaxID=2968473 RepID=UPI002118F861|nr:RidA family protein [Aurantimonas sp. MSK8Z-1]MCW4113446.1 RidA family protein [Aurantimonas sp. MSK8Z-1]